MMMMIIIIVSLMIKSKEPFRASTKDDILQPYITNDDFRYSNAGVVELDYNLYVFDIRYQQNLQLPNQLEWNLNLIEFFLMM